MSDPLFWSRHDWDRYDTAKPKDRRGVADHARTVPVGSSGAIMGRMSWKTRTVLRGVVWLSGLAVATAPTLWLSANMPAHVPESVVLVIVLSVAVVVVLMVVAFGIWAKGDAADNVKADEPGRSREVIVPTRPPERFVWPEGVDIPEGEQTVTLGGW